MENNTGFTALLESAVSTLEDAGIVENNTDATLDALAEDLMTEDSVDGELDALCEEMTEDEMDKLIDTLGEE